MEKRTRTCDGCKVDLTHEQHWKVEYQSATRLDLDVAPRHYCFDCLAKDAMPNWKPGH